MNCNGKKLLILGAGRGQVGLIKAAKGLGIFTVVVTMTDNYPGVPLADKVRHANIKDSEAILKIAKEEKVDGAAISCLDTGIRSLGYLTKNLNICAIPEKAALLSSNKLLMKDCLSTAGVRTAKYLKIKNITELKNATEHIKFPAVVKAVDLQGSRGVYIVKNYEEAVQAFNLIHEKTAVDFCIIEEYISGREFGAQAFIYKGEILFILPHGDETIMCGTAVPIGHYVPLNIDAALCKDVLEQAERAIKAIGLDNCAVNIDFMEQDKKAYVIELTGRVGANCLPELTSNYFGINYYEMIASMAVGEDPRGIFSQKTVVPMASISRMLFSEKTGALNGFSYPKIENLSINMFVKEGDHVCKFQDSNDAIGEVVIFDNTVKDCYSKLDLFMEKFKLNIF